jgi:hypothetical protein
VAVSKHSFNRGAKDVKSLFWRALTHAEFAFASNSALRAANSFGCLDVLSPFVFQSINGTAFLLLLVSGIGLLSCRRTTQHQAQLSMLL